MCGLADRVFISTYSTAIERSTAIAIYHCSIKIISRGKGKSAVAAAAYRAGVQITNQHDGVIHDYTSKRGIVHTEILLPNNAPPEYLDHATLWNAVEKIEKAKNSQLAREIEIALPKELTTEQQKSLVREYCQKHFVSVGMCADISIHDKKDGNPHAHIMLTMRPINEDGSWGAKQKKEYILDKNGDKIYDKKKRQYKCNSVNVTDWNQQTKAEEWRAAWANIANQYLQQNNVDEKIDHRSYKRQGFGKIPTIHLGVSAFQMESKGNLTDRGNINRETKDTNNQTQQLNVRIEKLEKWLKEETTSTNLQDIVSVLLSSNQSKIRWQKTTDLKTVAMVLSFLQANRITNMTQLAEKVTTLRGNFDTVSNKLKAAERQYATLNDHIKQGEIYLKHKAVYSHYRQEKNPKKRDAFYNNHQSEIILFEAAKGYLGGVLKDHILPLKAWKTEHTQLAADKKMLYSEYSRLREKTLQVETIKGAIEKLARNADDKVRPERKNYNVEL